MRNITRRAMGSYFQLAKAIGSPIIPPANSSINEAVNNPDVVPFQPVIPTAGMEFPDDYNYQLDNINNRMQYLAIGTGGHFATHSITNNRPRMGNKVASARHTGMFELFPFVIRTLDNDLTTEQRTRYRMRKVIEINGILYAAYFLRHVDLSSATITQNIVKKDKGVISSQPYKPVYKDLVPDDPIISGANDGTYIQTLIAMDLTFDSQEAAWIREAAEIWYGDAEDGIISEIAICSGVDKPITKRYPQTGNQVAQPVASSLKEAVAVQISVSETVYHPMTFNNGSVTEKIYIGTEDPLYGTNFTANP